MRKVRLSHYVPAPHVDCLRAELLLKRLSEGMQHWKVTLKDRVKHELQEQLAAAVDARVDKVVAFESALRRRGEEVRGCFVKQVKTKQMRGKSFTA